MTTGQSFLNLVLLVGVASSAAFSAPRLPAQDCNQNGVPDEIDLGFPGEATARPAELHSLAIAAADLNGDGRQDLIKAETELRSGAARSAVVVLLGNGDGTFQFLERFPVGDWPWALIAADLDGDGDADLATANRDSADISVLLGNGDGTVGAERRHAAGANVQALDALDLDGAGGLDLVSAGNESADGVERSFVLVLLGNGDGGFREPARLPLEGRTAGVAAGDFNGDGRQDLLAVNSAESLLQGHRDPILGVLLLGNGDGTFAAEQRFQIGVSSLPERIHAVDINGDGRLDVALNFNFSTAVLFGNGDGSFQAAVFSDLRGSLKVFVDWSGDGRLDVITAETTDPNLAGSTRLDVYAGNGDGSFALATCIVVGVEIRALVATDVNTVGFVDLASANAGFSDVSIFLFDTGMSVDFATGFQPYALARADLNGDGRLDLATANRYSNDLSVLLGNGDGSFQTERRYAAGREAVGILALDLDGDGRLDLATVNQASSDVSVLLGNGDGSFQGQRRFATGRRPAALAAADLNGDGRVDIVTANLGPNTPSGEITVLTGTGGGNFTRERSFVSGPDPIALIAANLDGDGRVDLATLYRGFYFSPINNAPPAIALHLGNGDGTFSAARHMALGLYAARLVAADLNGDGRMDLAAGGHVGGEGGIILEGPGVFVFPGNGDGTFGRNEPIPGPFNMTVRAALDLDGDDRLDLVASVGDGNFVSALLGNGDGTFQPERRFDGSLYNPTDLVAGDLNGDGFVDLAAANSEFHDVVVIPGNGDGSFQAPERFAVGLLSSTDSRSVLVTADLDGDGFLDLAMPHVEANIVVVRLGSRDGTFGGARSFAAGSQPEKVVAADLNGDGRFDLTVLSGSHIVSVLLGNGDGTFQPPRATFAGVTVPPVIADFNGDGHADFVTGSSDADHLSLLVGLGDGTFARSRDIALGQGLSFASLLAADLNGDHAPDLVVTMIGSASPVLVLLGNGDGTFQPAASVSIGSYTQNLLAADFNADGFLDLVGPTYSPILVLSVALGNGDGTFQAPRSFGAGLAPIAIAAADLNGDGAVDLAAANIESRDLSVLLGNGDGTFQAERRFARGTLGYTLITADFNVDGRTDLASVFGGDVSILLNKLGADWESPRLTCPEAIAMVVHCTSPAGAVVDFQALVEDVCDPSPALTCEPPSGSVFPAGTTLVACTARDASGNRSQCRFEVTVTCGGRQLPGDCNQDGSTDISDAICLLGYLFLGSPAPLPCGDGSSEDPGNRDLLDWNASSALDLSDAIGLLTWLFQGGPPHAMGEECREIDGCAEVCGP